MKILLLSALLSAVFAPSVALGEDNKRQTTSEEIEDAVGSGKEDDNEVDADIGDDKSLVSEEFTYASLFDHSYGIIAGIGKSFPRSLIHLEVFKFLSEHLSLSLAFGTMKTQHTNKKEYDIFSDKKSVSLRTKYFITMLPLSFNLSSGLAFWEGKVAPDNSSPTSYQSKEAYLGVSVGAYYFWKGIYLETIVYGLSIGKSFGMSLDKNKKFTDRITEEIEGLEQYGLFSGNTLNLAVGYVF